MKNIGEYIRDIARLNIEYKIWQGGLCDNIGANIKTNIRDNILINTSAKIWDRIGSNIYESIKTNLEK